FLLTFNASYVINTLSLHDALPISVIGILPPSFWSPDPAEMLVPWVDSDLAAKSRGDHDFGVIGHLRPGISVKQANAELDTIEHRSEEHTSELQSPCNLVCRLLLEK